VKKWLGKLTRLNLASGDGSAGARRRIRVYAPEDLSGQAMDAQFVKWLMEHQKEAGVFSTVTTLVDQLTDNPAAKMTAQEIAQRVQQARVELMVEW
jgi:hypothetical protein